MAHHVIPHSPMSNDLMATKSPSNFLFFLKKILSLGDLVATRSFDVGTQRTTQWPLGLQMKKKKKQLGGH
jgi:hypothetical protein